MEEGLLSISPFSPEHCKPGAIVHASNPSTQEVENQEFRVILGYTANLRLAWAT